MKYSIRPKVTKYHGTIFRSKLEAKWAVFFDQMNISWKYEPAKFRFSENVTYLPDFYLDKWDLYIEVKPKFPATDFLYRQVDGVSPNGEKVKLFKIKSNKKSQIAKGHLLGSILSCEKSTISPFDKSKKFTRLSTFWLVVIRDIRE